MGLGAGTWQLGIVLQLVPGVPSEQMRIFYPDDGWDEVMDLDEPTVAWRKKGRVTSWPSVMPRQV